MMGRFYVNKTKEYSQVHIQRINQAQENGLIYPATADDITMTCPYCKQWLFGYQWSKHYACYKKYLKEQEVIIKRAGVMPVEEDSQ